MVEPCSGIKTCKSIKVSKFNFRPGIPFDAPRVSCVNESTNQFFNAPRNALNLENGDANRIHRRMKWYCIWLLPMLNDDRPRDCFIREPWRANTCKVDWVTRVSRVISRPTEVVRRAFRARLVFIAFACHFKTTNDEWRWCWRRRRRRWSKAIASAEYFGSLWSPFNDKPYILARDCAKQIGKARGRDRSGQSNLVSVGSISKVLSNSKPIDSVTPKYLLINTN